MSIEPDLLPTEFPLSILTLPDSIILDPEDRETSPLMSNDFPLDKNNSPDRLVSESPDDTTSRPLSRTDEELVISTEPELPDDAEPLERRIEPPSPSSDSPDLRVKEPPALEVDFPDSIRMFDPSLTLDAPPRMEISPDLSPLPVDNLISPDDNGDEGVVNSNTPLEKPVPDDNTALPPVVELPPDRIKSLPND
ncbi:MAG: hypothetical protein JW384_03928 [Nitrosomonadaceae bacterium]|nr:hypothetical protein [Nitrosomonadaceae bacterium]